MQTYRMPNQLKNRYFLLLLVIIAVFGTQVYAEDETTGSVGINYQTAPDDDQSTLQLDLSLDLSQASSVYIAYANLKSEDNDLPPELSFNNLSASVTEVGLEHWFSQQTFGLGLSYSSWNDDNQLKNNDLTVALNFQTLNWLLGLDVTRRDLELSIAVFIPDSGLINIERENDGLGIGISAIYGGWKNFLLAFEHKQYDYDGEIVDHPRFAQIQSLLFATNNPLEEKTTGVTLGHYTDSDKFITLGVTFDTSLLAGTDSTQYNVNYEFPIADNLTMDLGYLYVDQDLGNTNVFSLGLDWSF